MSNERLPAKRRDHGLVFDPGQTSPLVRRGLALLAAQASIVVEFGDTWSLLWTSAAPNGSAISGTDLPELLVEDGSIYASTTESLISIDPRTGAELWRIDVELAKGWVANLSEFEQRGWGRIGGLLVHSGGKRGLCAVDEATGVNRWCTDRQSRERLVAIAADQGLVYTSVNDPANDQDGYICAIDADTGTTRWCRRNRDEVIDETYLLPTQVVLAFEEKAIIFDTYRRITAVNSVNGTIQWCAEESYVFPLFLDIGLAYVLESEGDGDESGVLAALDIATGRERWRFEAPEGRLSLVKHRIIDGAVHVVAWTPGISSERQSMYALEAHNGTVRWGCKLSGEHRPSDVVFWGFDSLMSNIDGQALGPVETQLLYRSADAEILAIDRPNGAERWRFAPLQGGTGTTLRLRVGETAIYVSDAGRLYALDKITGVVRWTFERLATGFRVESDVVSEAANVVTVVCGNGCLYALDAENGTIRDQFVFLESPTMADIVQTMFSHLLHRGEDFSGDPNRALRESEERLHYALSEAERLLAHAGTEPVVASMEAIQRRLDGPVRRNRLRFKL